MNTIISGHRGCHRMNTIISGHRGCHRMIVLDLLLPLQSVPITTKVVSSNSAQVEVYSIHYVINYVSDLRQVGGFLQILRFPLPIKLTATI